MSRYQCRRKKKRSFRLEKQGTKGTFQLCSVLGHGPTPCSHHLGCILVLDSYKGEGEERVCYFYATTVFIDHIFVSMPWTVPLASMSLANGGVEPRV